MSTSKNEDNEEWIPKDKFFYHYNIYQDMEEAFLNDLNKFTNQLNYILWQNKEKLSHFCWHIFRKLQKMQKQSY